MLHKGTLTINKPVQTICQGNNQLFNIQYIRFYLFTIFVSNNNNAEANLMPQNGTLKIKTPVQKTCQGNNEVYNIQYVRRSRYFKRK